jgi:hypothetical protein
MPTTEYRPQTILALDFGTASTRAALIDVVEGQFRHVASGQAPSTFNAPYFDVMEGMRHALEDLAAVTGRRMLNDNAQLISPVDQDGYGADLVAATVSGGPALRTALVGLLPEFSLGAARAVAASAYLDVVETFSLTDRRSPQQQIDAMVAARPDFILLAGGRDGGARESIIRLAETVGLGAYRLGGTRRHVLYLGNEALKERVSQMLKPIATVTTAPNIQPAVGTIAPLMSEVGRAATGARAAQVAGLSEITAYAQGRLLPTAQAAGTLVQFMSKGTTPWRRILFADVGSQSTALAYADNGALVLNIYPDLGVGVSAERTLAAEGVEAFGRWLPGEPAEDAIRDFAGYKSRVAAHTVPVTADDLYAELALARAAVRAALRRARTGWPRQSAALKLDLIIGAGATIGQAPHPGLSAMALLDAIGPIGATTLMLDRQHIAAALGAAGYFNPLAAVQSLEGGALLTLGTAISISHNARAGELVANAKLVDDAGREAVVDVHAGAIELVALKLGQVGKLTLKPKGRSDVGFGPGRMGTHKVVGGQVGLLLDGRGRPLVTPRDPAERAERLQQWMFVLGS